MKKTITIGSRGSQLALTQTNHVADMIRSATPGIEVNVEVITTKGDRILDTPLAKIGGKGLFTKELETALLEGRVDLAVHSLKDLPTDLPEGLCVGATPPRATPNDALVCERWPSLAEMPDGAKVGTSSLRRKAQLLAVKPGLDIVDLRGNIDTRMRRVTEGVIDAAILACAGIERIGRAEAIAEVLSPAVMLPAVGQGALALETREGDRDVLDVLDTIGDAATEAETAAERILLAALGGGCQVPIGALARVTGETLSMEACVCSLDGTKVLRTTVSGAATEAASLGRQAADALIGDGADALIAEVESGE